MTRLEWLIIHVKMRSIFMGLCDLIVLRYRTHSFTESENLIWQKLFTFMFSFLNNPWVCVVFAKKIGA